MPCLEGFPCFSIFFPRYEEVTCTITRICRLIFIVELDMYIYLINQARGPYWENIGPRSWQYGPSAARSVQKRPRADILPGRSRASLLNKRPRADILPGRSQASLVNKRFITRLKLFRRKTQMIDCKDTKNFKRAILVYEQTERLLTSDVFKKKKNKVGRKQK